MTFAIQSVPPEDFGKPSNLVEKKVNWDTGYAASEVSPSDSVTTEQYWDDNVPAKKDTAESVKKGQQKRKSSENQEEKVRDFFNL